MRRADKRVRYAVQWDFTFAGNAGEDHVTSSSSLNSRGCQRRTETEDLQTVQSGTARKTAIHRNNGNTTR